MKPEDTRNHLPGYLLVVPWDLSFVGGVNEVVRNLYREFQEQHIAVPLVLIPRWECRKLTRQILDGRDSLHLRMPAPPPPGRDFPKKCASFLAGWPGTLRQLYTLIKGDRIRVVNAHYPGPFLTHFAILKRLFPRLFSFTISLHGSDVIAIEKNEPHTSAVRWILRSADHITVPSRSLAARLLKVDPDTAGRTTCIYNGVAEDKFRLANDRNNPPAALPQGEIILHVGSFEKIKGQDVLLHAFKHVLQVHSDCRLLLVGRSGSFLPEVETICADLEIAHAVSIMKDVAPERIPQLMANAMFVVLPSRYEGGVPLVLLEAGAVKKAVVASDAGGIAELITPGRNGLLVPPDNPQALAQAMLNLLDDRQLMQEMGGKLYDTIAGAFSWKTTACRYLELAMK